MQQQHPTGMLTPQEIESLRQDKQDALRLCQRAFNHLIPADRLPEVLRRQAEERAQWAAEGWTEEAARERQNRRIGHIGSGD
jgi:hypothetical protein